MKQKIKNFINKLPHIRNIVNELEKANQVLAVQPNYPIGHFYSPIVSAEEIKQYEQTIFARVSKTIQGIDLNEVNQLDLLHKLSTFYSELPFKDKQSKELRYYFDNAFYSYSDAIFLYSMIRNFKPKSIIEVGSGFSSAVMLDTNELFFDGKINLTFVEPYPDRLFGLFKEKDKISTKTLVNKVQDVDMKIFETLEANDILFIDSTHVSKTGSDVNKIIFEILPMLKSGVIIHVHDIFYPFEYPKDWVLGWKGFGWNEAYLLKAFLMYNTQFSILFFNTYLSHFERDWFELNMPLCLKNEGGSIWLKKM